MRCAIVTAVYPPEPVVSAQTSRDIAVELKRRGADVEVIAPFPNRPGGQLQPGTRRRLFASEERDGVHITRCFATLSPSGSMVARLVENLSFGIMSSLRLLLTRKPDVIYANTWPVFATALVTTAARLRRIPLVLSIQDLYPESLASQGRVALTSVIARVLRAIDRRNARTASHVCVISDRFADVYKHDRGIASENVTVIPNWGSSFDRSSAAEIAAFRSALGVPEHSFLMVYGGNIGRAAGVENLIEAMALLSDVRVSLVIAGDGSELPAVRRRVAELRLTNVTFRSPWPRDETVPLLSCADLLLLPTSGEQSQASVPSKLISYLFAGAPVLATALRDSDTAAMIEASGGGWTVPPDSPASLAARIREISAMPSETLSRRGAAGRAFAQGNLDRDVCLPRLAAIIDEATARRV